MSYPWFSAVAGGLPEPVILLSLDGRILALNPAARTVVGGAGEGLQADICACTTDPERFRRYLKLASRTATPLPGSAELLGSPTRWRSDCCSARLEDARFLVLHLRAATDTAQRFMALNQQIGKLHAEIRRREALEKEREELFLSEQAARQAAEEASRHKDEVLAGISHELRTPLHAMTGWLALMRETLDDRALLLQGLEVLERNVAAETQLTEDLVDMSLMITGRMTLDIQRVDLEHVIQEAVASARPAIEAKQQRLQLMTSVGGCIINGDPNRLQQIVWNLLSNATKYTPKGGRIQVILRCLQSSAEIVVSDSGEGIDEDVLPFVFDRFRRADASITRRSGGLGLGLSIVRQLVELHGGVVMVESDGVGRGSTFTVSLPLPLIEPRATPAIESHPSQRGSELHGLRVLLVEDHDDSRVLLASILKTQGAEVTAFESAPAALSAYEEQAADVIISDIEMPGEDGFTLMRKLRAIEAEQHRSPTPAVAVSAHTLHDARLHALKAGYQTFLKKPVRPAELIVTVASLCKGWGAKLPPR